MAGSVRSAKTFDYDDDYPMDADYLDEEDFSKKEVIIIPVVSINV